MGVSKNGGYHGEAEVDVNHWIWGKIWHCLVGGLKPSEKYESQLGLIFPTEWEKTCSKPPTRIYWNMELSKIVPF